MNDSNSTPYSVELGSDSDTWPEQDEVVHNLPKDVKECFGMLVFAKFAGHPPHPAVVWDPRFSLPKVKKQWYQSNKKDKEYIVKWLGYAEESPVWNKVPKRSIEEAKPGSSFDEYCKKSPNEGIYQKGCDEIRKAFEEGITNKQRWREQRKNQNQIVPMKKKGTPGRKKINVTPSPVPSSSAVSAQKRKRRGADSDEEVNSSGKLKLRRSVLTRRGSSCVSSSRSISREEEEETVTAEPPKKMKAQIHNTKSPRRSLRRKSETETTTAAPLRSVDPSEQQHIDNNSELSSSESTLKRGEEELMTEVNANAQQQFTASEPLVVVRHDDESHDESHDESQEHKDDDVKQKLEDSSAMMNPLKADVPAVVAQQTHSSVCDDEAGAIKGGPAVTKSVLSRRSKSKKGFEQKSEELLLPPDQIDTSTSTTPVGRVAQCVERLKTAIDNGNIEEQLEALDKLEEEKFDFEVMKKTRAGKVVSKLVRKSRNIDVGNKAGALEKQWRGLLESKEDQDMEQQKGTITTAILSLPTVSLKQEQQGKSQRMSPPPCSSVIPSPSPKSINVLGEDTSCSKLKQQTHQRPPLVVAKQPSPKLDAMALLEDVMPRVDLVRSWSSSEPRGDVHSYSRKVTVSHRRFTSESGIPPTTHFQDLKVNQPSAAAAGDIQHLDFVRKRGLSLLTMGLCKPHCSGPNQRPSKGEIEKAKDIESAIFTATNHMVDNMHQCGDAYKDRIRVVSMLLGNHEKSGRKLYSKVMSGLIVVNDLVTKSPLELLCWVN